MHIGCVVPCGSSLTLWSQMKLCMSLVSAFPGKPSVFKMPVTRMCLTVDSSVLAMSSVMHLGTCLKLLISICRTYLCQPHCCITSYDLLCSCHEDENTLI